jgi:hypothetical protein
MVSSIVYNGATTNSSDLEWNKHQFTASTVKPISTLYLPKILISIQLVVEVHFM